MTDKKTINLEKKFANLISNKFDSRNELDDLIVIDALLDVYKDMINLDDFLKIALSQNNLEVAEHLIKKGANIDDVKDNYLLYASMLGATEMVRFLIKYDANINAREGSPLMYGVTQKNIELTTCLIEHGAIVQSDDNELLRVSIDNNDVKMVELLLKNMSENINNSSDILKRCLSVGNLDILKLLEKHKTNFEFSEDLYSIIIRNEHIDIIKYMIFECGCDVDVFIEKAKDNNLSSNIEKLCQKYKETIALEQQLQVNLKENPHSTSINKVKI